MKAAGQFSRRYRNGNGEGYEAEKGQHPGRIDGTQREGKKVNLPSFQAFPPFFRLLKFQVNNRPDAAL